MTTNINIDIKHTLDDLLALTGDAPEGERRSIERRAIRELQQQIELLSVTLRLTTTVIEDLTERLRVAKCQRNDSGLVAAMSDLVFMSEQYIASRDGNQSVDLEQFRAVTRDARRALRDTYRTATQTKQESKNGDTKEG